VSGWLFKKKSITMFGNMNVKHEHSVKTIDANHLAALHGRQLLYISCYD